MINQDLSANTLETARKNMTVISFMIIVFFFTGGHVPDGNILIKFPLSNVQFENPERMIYILWAVMFWWTYRYFSLGAVRLIDQGISDDLCEMISHDSPLYKAMVVSIGNEHDHRTWIKVRKLKLSLFKPSTITIGLHDDADGGVGIKLGPDPRKILTIELTEIKGMIKSLLMALIFRGYFISFLTPLVLQAIAVYLMMTA